MYEFMTTYPYQGQQAVFLGDSITFGYELQLGEKPYPQLVSEALKFHQAGHERLASRIIGFMNALQ